MFPPLKDTAISRATEADPNQGRCLIENCPKERAVRPIHVLPRALSKKGFIMDCLEHRWDLRRGTLNLDTRSNVMFVGSSLANMYAKFCWALLPEESVIDQFFTPYKSPFLRKEFNSVFPGPFNYTFVPLHSMENVGIFRQNQCPPVGQESFTIHTYPFDALQIQSHIQPRFVIAALGRILVDSPMIKPPRLRELMAMYPSVRKVIRLYTSWMTSISHFGPYTLRDRLKDKTYAPLAGGEEKEKECASDADSVCTEPRRIEEVQLQPQDPPAKRRRSASPEREGLTTKKVRFHEDTFERDRPSLGERVSSRARESEGSEISGSHSDDDSDGSSENVTPPPPWARIRTVPS